MRENLRDFAKLQSVNTILYLKRGDTILGKLTLYEVNQPWFNCKFEPTESFAEVKHLFDKRLNMMDTADAEEWEEADIQFDAMNLRLVYESSGEEIDELLLNIKDDEAWFRY